MTENERFVVENLEINFFPVRDSSRSILWFLQEYILNLSCIFCVGTKMINALKMNM